MYAAGKHGLRVVAEGLRRELRDMGTKIRVTVSQQIYVNIILRLLISYAHCKNVYFLKDIDYSCKRELPTEISILNSIFIIEK